MLCSCVIPPRLSDLHHAAAAVVVLLLFLPSLIGVLHALSQGTSSFLRLTTRRGTASCVVDKEEEAGVRRSWLKGAAGEHTLLACLRVCVRACGSLTR